MAFKKTHIVISAVVVLFALWFFQRGVMPPKEAETDFKLNAFAHLPVKFDGRKKPIDTFARNLLTKLSGKQSARDAAGEKVSATTWLLDNISGRPEAMDYEVFRIENLDMLSSLELERRKGLRYSYRELLSSQAMLNAAARTVFAKEARDRDPYDKQVLKLANNIHLYQNAMASFEDPSGIPFEQRRAVSQRYAQLETLPIPLVIPPTAGNGRWRPLMSALLDGEDPQAIRFASMLGACRSGSVEQFNRGLVDFREHIQPDSKLPFEVFYNRLSAFMKSAQLYLLVFVLSLFGWLFRKEGIISAARILLVCAFVPHTFGIVARSFLSGYPPVTNLYSSAIFVGWGAVAAGIVLEWGFRRKVSGIGNLVGGVAGFVTLLIAHFLAGRGDTMEQMRAVLDTRFWLTTHVVTISLGYMATFVAGVIGVFYILSGLLSRRLDKETAENLYRMIYGTVCFALLFSFVGTVLGGLWADDSWGRFWGWDPKENGALLIVMWNAIMLHARYGKMVGGRGFAVMAVVGHIVTAWSWFGVNQLGVGLHSYGFTQSAAFWLLVFVASQLAVVLLGLIPARLWKSGGIQ